MASSTAAASSYDYDLVVLGGGSGGIASAKRAANSYGKKVAVVERGRLGGTCVNVGCVPKKLMFQAATLAETMRHDVKEYGFAGGDEVTFDWAELKRRRDAYIRKLNGIYGNGLDSADVDTIRGDGTFVDAHTVQVKDGEGGSTRNVTAANVVIAVGGRPNYLEDVPGIEHTINSDQFFEIEEQPKKVAVLGAGYIAVELSGVFNGLGTETHLCVRGTKALRSFEDSITDHLMEEMVRQGVHVHNEVEGIEKVVVDEATGKKTVHLLNGETVGDLDVVLMAVGRVPNTESLNLDKAGVDYDGKTGYIQTDEYQNTSASSVYALGDVCGKVELTPMAIAAGRRLADRLFSDDPALANAKVSYEGVPTVIFSHPPIGTIGLSERQAVDKYGERNVKVYNSKFPNLYYGVFALESADKPKTVMKVITAGKTELVVGVHVIGMGADEMMQGFGVALKMGATKADLDSCVAIHPTASEEFVTMGTWGTAPPASGAKVAPLLGAPGPEPELE